MHTATGATPFNKKPFQESENRPCPRVAWGQTSFRNVYTATGAAPFDKKLFQEFEIVLHKFCKHVHASTGTAPFGSKCCSNVFGRPEHLAIIYLSESTGSIFPRRVYKCGVGLEFFEKVNILKIDALLVSFGVYGADFSP